jgi:hypothetical protein
MTELLSLKRVKGALNRGKSQFQGTQNPGRDTKCRQRRTKALRYDTAVPGDRGDCEKESLVQGSE